MIKLFSWIGLIILLSHGFLSYETSRRQGFATMAYLPQQPAEEDYNSPPKQASPKTAKRYSQQTPLNLDTVDKVRLAQDTPSPIQLPEPNSQKKS